VPDFSRALSDLGRRSGAAAALVLETAGIEVASWGDAEFETAAAEFAGLWREVCATETARAVGVVRALTVEGSLGTWVAVPLGAEYVLSLLSRPGVPPGRLRFWAGEWAREQGGHFA